MLIKSLTKKKIYGVSLNLIRIGVYDDNIELLSVISKAIDADKRFNLVFARNSIDKIYNDILIHNPDIILFDLSIAEEKAFLLISEIRSSFSKLKIVVFTGYNDPNIKKLSISAGAALIIDKGVPLSDLFSKIESICL
jgi:DNA-binding NarL/FixJ family response regulator